MSNVPGGGHILVGFDDDGNFIETEESLPGVDQVSQVIANRTLFTPPGISVRLLDYEENSLMGKIMWLEIPPNPYSFPSSFRDHSGLLKTPVRVGAITKYLTPPEAVAYFQKREQPPLSAPLHDFQFQFPPDETDEQLEANLYPVIELPTSLWSCGAGGRTPREIAEARSVRLPNFRVWKDRIYSLHDAETCRQAFGSEALATEFKESFIAVLQDPERLNLALSLLNKAIRSHAISLYLGFDKRTDRLYFRPRSGRPWKYRWKAFKRESERTVVGVRKKLDGSVSHWYHFAVWLRFERAEDTIALKLIPTWLFSHDGRKVMRNIGVASVATRKNSLEDNARILYNRLFWIRFLAKGRKTVVIHLGSKRLRISTQPLLSELEVGISDDAIDARMVSLPDEDPPDFFEMEVGIDASKQ